MKTYNQNNGQFRGDDKRNEDKPGMGNDSNPDSKSKSGDQEKK